MLSQSAAGFLALGLEGCRAGAEDMGGLFLGDDGAVHCAGTQCPVRVGIEVDEQTFGAASQVQQGGAPGAPILRGGRCVNLDQPMGQINHSKCRTQVLVININISGNGLHAFS